MKRTLPWIWTGLIVVVAVLLAAFAAPEFEVHEAVSGAFFLASIIVMTALGSVVTARRPGNRIAWLLHLIALTLLLTLWASAMLDKGPPESPGFPEYLAAMVGTPSGMTALYSIFLLLYVFPTGRFPTPRWRWAGWIGAVLVPATWIVSSLSTDLGGAWDADGRTIPNPIGVIPIETMEFVGPVWPLAVLVMAIGGVTAMVVRFRRSDLMVRTQIKWVLYAAVITLLSLPFAFSEIGLVSDLLTAIVLNAIPVAVAVAVARYKLFDIDRIISRTVSYAIVIGLLAVVFAAGVTWIPSALDLGDNPLLVAGSTLAVAALFNPLRRRVQHVVDRRFNRSRYQAERVSDQFATKLREPLTVDELSEAWSETVDECLQPISSGVWLRDA